MKKILIGFAMMIASITSQPAVEAVEHYQEIYPVNQIYEGYRYFPGDRYHEFAGDLLAHLSDGSDWKIHPDSRENFLQWQEGDTVRVKVRTDFYFRKREHKFALYNIDRNESVKVMLIQHKTMPEPLTVVSAFPYAKVTKMVSTPKTILKNRDGRWVKETEIRYDSEYCEMRTILYLSDGSTWVIKDKFEKFPVGSRVYIGAQGRAKAHYDFVLIVGDQREAEWTYARPQQ